MRILHVITRLILGGAQENTLLTCEGLHARGHDICLAAGPPEGPEGDLLERARHGGYRLETVDCLRREIAPRHDAAALVGLDRLIRRFRPEIVHTHSSKAGILGRLAARRRGVPGIVHTVHGVAFGATASRAENAVYIPLERLAARWTHRIVSVADAMTAQSLAVRIGRADQYVTIRSGMETAPFLEARRDRERVRAELGVAPGERLVGQVGRLAPRKGYEDVLAAASRLFPAMPDLKFVLVGDGPLRPDLERIAHGAGPAGRIIFTGLASPDRIPGLMAAMDVLVHASVREGLPRVVPQALLAGTPVVCCNVDGAPEVVLPGRTGFLFAPHDVDAIAGALAQLLGDADLRHRFAAAGREWCRDRFDHNLMVERIEAECLALLDAKPMGRRTRA